MERNLSVIFALEVEYLSSSVTVIGGDGLKLADKRFAAACEARITDPRREQQNIRCEGNFISPPVISDVTIRIERFRRRNDAGQFGWHMEFHDLWWVLGFLLS